MPTARELKRLAIKTLTREKLSVSQIATKLKIDPKTVRLWQNRRSFEDKPRQGRPSKLSPVTKREIKRNLIDLPGASVQKVVRDLNQLPSFKKRSKTISRPTVQRYVQTTDWGRKAYKVPKEPRMSIKNIEDRLKFAKKLQETGYCDPGPRGQKLRQNIIWTDECPIHIEYTPNTQNYRIRTQDKSTISPTITTKHPMHIMVAGGISANGVTELWMSEPKQTINSQVYRDEILPLYIKAANTKELFQNKNKVILQQDNAPPHIEKSVTRVIEANFSEHWGKGIWPGASPDLNVIENIWPLIKSSVTKNPQPKNRAELKARIIETWYSVPKPLLKKLAESLPKRIKTLLANNGRKINY